MSWILMLTKSTTADWGSDLTSCQNSLVCLGKDFILSFWYSAVRLVGK